MLDDIKKVGEDLTAKVNAKYDEMSKEMAKFNDALKNASADTKAEAQKSIDVLTTQITDLRKAQEKSAKDLEDAMLDIKRVDIDVDKHKDSGIAKELEKHADKLKAWDGSAVQMNIKSTMLNSTHSGDVSPSTILPGVYYTPERVDRVRNYMNVLPVAGADIRYMQETAFTNSVGARAEGSAGSESDLTLTEQTASPKIISTYFTVSKESLSDIPYLAGLIATRGREKLLSKEDTEILYGTGLSNRLSGITTVATAYSDAMADSAVNRFDVIAAGVTQARVSEYRPNVTFVHPTDYDLMAREKGSNGQYILPGAVFNGSMFSIYGCRVVATTAVTSDDFIIGDFAMGATLGIRSDVTVEISREHSSNFTAGLVTVLVEERLLLPIYRTDAFRYGDFSNALALGSA